MGLCYAPSQKRKIVFIMARKNNKERPYWPNSLAVGSGIASSGQITACQKDIQNPMLNCTSYIFIHMYKNIKNTFVHM